MSKNKNKNKNQGSNPNNNDKSPPSVPDSVPKRMRPDQVMPMDTLVNPNDQSTSVDLMLSSLRREALGPERQPPSTSNSPPQEGNRTSFIDAQLDNRYSINSLPPFVTFVEINNSDSNPPQQDRKFIGNLHPLYISKRLCTQFNHLKINCIKRVGRNLISVTFDTFQQANIFVSARSALPKDWISYIPNFKLFRSGVIRNVDKSLSIQDIRDGISWPDSSINIIQLERLKYRARDSDLLLESSSVKIVFESSLLPEYLYIWKMRYSVSPFIQSIRRCQNCARIGHSTAFCRSSPACAICSMGHITSACNNDSFNCINCGGEHRATDPVCPMINYNKTINTIMAYLNSSRAVARRIMRARNISSVKQAEGLLRSHAYRAWDSGELDHISRSNIDQNMLAFPPLLSDNHPVKHSNYTKPRPSRTSAVPKIGTSLGNMSGMGP